MVWPLSVGKGTASPEEFRRGVADLDPRAGIAIRGKIELPADGKAGLRMKTNWICCY